MSGRSEVSEGGEENLSVAGRPRKGNAEAGARWPQRSKRIAELERLVGRQRWPLIFKQACCEGGLRQRERGLAGRIFPNPSKMMRQQGKLAVQTGAIARVSAGRAL